MIKKLNHYSIPCGCSNLPPTQDREWMPAAWEPRYVELSFSEDTLLRRDETGAYTPQGACTDGTYIYRALVKEDEEPAILQKIDLKTGEIILENSSRAYGHANCLTIGKDGKLVIAHSSSTSILYEVDPATLTFIRAFNISTTIWGVAYEETNDLYIVGNVGAAYVSVYDSDWAFMYRIKPENAFSGSVRQGIFCDVNYIYINVDNAYGAIIGNDLGSRVFVYTWNGMFIKSIHLPIKEVEWAFYHSGKMYIGTYEGRDVADIKTGEIYAIPFDLYPEQTVLTGRPTDVSGGVNNLQRLPEGTPVRLWQGNISSVATTFKLNSSLHGITIDEDGPFRYLRFRFKGANQGVFDWYPANDGVIVLREFDITAATTDSNIRFREMRLSFNVDSQEFTVESNFVEALLMDVSENSLTLSKPSDVAGIELTQIWGIV